MKPKTTPPHRTHAECKHSKNYYNLNWEKKPIMCECGNPDKVTMPRLLLSGGGCELFEVSKRYFVSDK